MPISVQCGCGPRLQDLGCSLRNLSLGRESLFLFTTNIYKTNNPPEKPQNSFIIPDLSCRDPRKQSLMRGICDSRIHDVGMGRVGQGQRDNPFREQMQVRHPYGPDPPPRCCEKNHRKAPQECLSLGNSSRPLLVKPCPGEDRMESDHVGTVGFIWGVMEMFWN